MATPVFQPAGPPGSTAATAQRSLGTSQRYFEGQQSMMERASRLRMDQETHAANQAAAERAKIEDAIMLPVKQSEARMHVAKVEAGVRNLARTQDLLAEFQKESQVAEEEWLSVMKIADPKSQANAALEWTGKWMKYAPLGDFSPIWNQRKEIAATFSKHAMDLRVIREKLNADTELEKTKAGLGGPDSPLGKMIGDYNKAVQTGRMDEANFLKAGIEAEVTPKGMRLEVGKDGSLIFAQGAQNGLTTAGTTRSEQAQFDAERSIREGADLLRTLRPEDLGIQGVIKEDFINKGLAQLRPEFADKTTSENRTKLRAWREGTMRQVSADTRFSNTDREAIERLLPQDGVFESLPSAQAKMLAVMNIMQDRAAKEAGRRGKISPLQSPEGIREAVKAGQMEMPVAVELLKALFPNFDPAKPPQ